MSNIPVELDRLDHFALTVRDVEQSCAFYEKVLGMARAPFGEGRVALRFGRHKININPTPTDLLRKAAVPVPGSAEFCVVSSAPLDDFIRHLRNCGIDIEYGPAETAGAEGTIRSICFRDPDGNLVEVAAYEGAAGS
jgi:catechol 2,3-dioxygenase-like lactoylglutathione lyase family enzyme